MYEHYDVAIIGGGPAAVFAAYEFTLKYPTVRLLMLEEGEIKELLSSLRDEIEKVEGRGAAE